MAVEGGAVERVVVWEPGTVSRWPSAEVWNEESEAWSDGVLSLGGSEEGLGAAVETTSGISKGRYAGFSTGGFGVWRAR